jgi:hypothetical protein
VVQTVVTGRMEADISDENADVLIVVDDVVAGVGHLTRDSVTGGTLAGLVAEDLVPDGANDIQILLPDGNQGWLAGESDEITIELVADDGHVLDVASEGSRRIQVDRVTGVDGGWDLVGWAADVSTKSVPDIFYVFAGDQLLYSGPPNVDNANVVRWFESEDLLRSGFEVHVSATDVPEGVSRLTVVAEFGDVAVADPATLTSQS